MSRLNVFTAALFTVLLAGCGGGGADPQPDPEPPTQTETTSAPEEPGPTLELESRNVSVAGGEVDLTVGPLAVDDDVAVLRLELTALQDGVSETFSSPYLRPAYGPTTVALIDADNGYVHHHGWSPAGAALTEDPGPVNAGETKEFFIAYAAPDTNAPVAVVPDAGIFLPPVVDYDEADGFPPVAELAGGQVEYPVSVLETYSEELGGVLAARDGEDLTILTVSADVLFDKDSAALSSAADAALERAAGRISGEGELRIVGHTDDVGTREHNQELSEDRAEAVAGALAGLVDLSAFEVTVEGRAFDEPATSGTSEEARAENRRVEIEFAAADSAAAPTSDADLPEARGPVGRGAEGVEVEQMDPSGSRVENTYDVKLTRVLRIGNYLAGEIELTNLDDEKHVINSVFSRGIRGSRGDLAVTDQVAATRLALADGDVLYYPLDYQSPERDYVMRGGERKSMGQELPALEAGQSAVITVVWPGLDADEVTLESPWIPAYMDRPEEKNLGGPPFRLTDVPVEEPQP